LRDRDGDFVNELLRPGVERPPLRAELEARALTPCQLELVDEIVQDAERIELGFLIRRSDGVGVPVGADNSDSGLLRGGGVLVGW
jgi:hypothetical protein